MGEVRESLCNGGIYLVILLALALSLFREIPVFGYYTDSVDLVQMPQDAASGQCHFGSKYSKIENIYEKPL